MDQVDAATFNNMFISSLDEPGGLNKAAQAGGAFVRDKLRELAFSRAIIPPEYVTKADCQRSVYHDTLVKIVDIEPKSQAAAVNFRGKAFERYIEGERYEIPFFKIESEKFQKNEAELLAFDYPVTKVIEENSVKDIQAVEDGKFIEFANAVCEANGSALEVASEAGPLTSKNLVKLMRIMQDEELAVGTILMNKSDWDDFMTQEAAIIGGPLASEILVNGYKYNTILGHKLVVTIKPIVPPGRIYAFADPKYLGNFYILNDTKFYIEKRADMVTWQTWEYVGMGFGNLRGVAMMSLF